MVMADGFYHSNVWSSDPLSASISVSTLCPAPPHSHTPANKEFIEMENLI